MSNPYTENYESPCRCIVCNEYTDEWNERNWDAMCAKCIAEGYTVMKCPDRKCARTVGILRKGQRGRAMLAHHNEVMHAAA